MASELASDMMLSIYLIGGGGGTQNYKVVKNKKGKSFIFLVVPSLRPMMIRLGTGPPSGRIRVPVDHRCLLSLHYGLRIGKESYGEALHER